MDKFEMLRGLHPIHSYMEQRGGRTTVFFPDFNEFLRMQIWMRESQDTCVPFNQTQVLPPSDYLTDED